MKVEVAVLSFPSLTSLVVSVDAMQHKLQALTGLRHPSLEEGARKRCSECACITELELVCSIARNIAGTSGYVPVATARLLFFLPHSGAFNQKTCIRPSLLQCTHSLTHLRFFIISCHNSFIFIQDTYPPVTKSHVPPGT